jgi:hypothetical protein
MWVCQTLMLGAQRVSAKLIEARFDILTYRKYHYLGGVPKMEI